MTYVGFEVCIRINLKFCWIARNAKILKIFPLNFEREINLIESVLDLTQKPSEWMLLQRFVYRLLGVCVYLRLGLVRWSEYTWAIKVNS